MSAIAIPVLTGRGLWASLMAALKAVATGAGESSRGAAGTNAAPSFETIFREHYGFVHASLRRLGVPDALTDDALQDVFVVVARRLAEFEGRSSMRTWLFAIAVRVARHQRRSSSRHQRKVEALGEVAAMMAQSDSMGRADSARVLRRLLESLDDDKRQVYLLMELHRLTAPETAEILGLKVPTVYSRLRLARAELTRTLRRLHKRGSDA